MDSRERNAHLQRALAFSGHTHGVGDVLEGVQDGRFQMWNGGASVIVTELEVYPKGKVCHFFLAGGNLTELAKMVSPILQWARTQGCTKATLTGRPGWKRSFLTRTGWREVPLVMMETDLR